MTSWPAGHAGQAGPGLDYAALGHRGVTWSLAMDLADQIPPAGIRPARPGPGRPARPGRHSRCRLHHPGRLRVPDRSPGHASRAAEARDAVHGLARAGLVTINPASTTRTVQVHPAIQAMTRGIIPPPEFERAVRCAADALMQSWPADPVPPRLAQALRDCTISLRECTGDLLWAPETHPVLMQAGQSLDSDEISGPGLAYWQEMLETSTRVLGPDHAQAFRCRDGLASAYGAPAGWTRRSARTSARSPSASGSGQRPSRHPRFVRPPRPGLRHRGPARRGPADVRAGSRRPGMGTGRKAPGYAGCPRRPGRRVPGRGRPEHALPVYEQTLADLERGLGPGHPDTLAARAGLAQAYHTVGKLKQAVPVYERTLADREKAQGPDHPDTISARADVAYAYRTAGRMKQALPLYERVVGDRERVLGSYHPDTLTARGNLANAYLAARRNKDAIAAYERTLADREVAQGPEDTDTMTARGNLANAYHSAGRLKDALPLYEQTLAACERVLGPTHQSTLTSRANLASAYHAALRLADAITVFERTLADCEQALGPDHPLTLAVRENLQAAQRT